MVQKGNGLLITVYGSTNDIASYEQELARNFIQIDYLKDSVVYSGSASLNKVYVSKDGDYYYRTLLNYDSGNITDPKDDMCTVQFQICRYNKYIKKD